METEYAADELADFAHKRSPYEIHWMDGRINAFLSRNMVIARGETDEGEIKDDGRIITAGSGPEYASADVHNNPNWLRNRALNLFAIADYLENRDAILAAKEAEATAARDKRRDELVNELAPRSPGLGGNWYMNVSIGLRKAVDRIIELEGAKK